MNYFQLEAYKEALKSPMNKKYGAVLIHRGRIVSRGHNSYRYIGTLSRHRVLCN